MSRRTKLFIGIVIVLNLIVPIAIDVKQWIFSSAAIVISSLLIASAIFPDKK